MPANLTGEAIARRAQETAERLVAMLGGGGLAAGFVRRYAEAHRRRALLAHAGRYRELMVRISREALLAMAARVEHDLSRRFGAGSRNRIRRAAQRDKTSDAALANQFRVEFYGRLAQLLDWQREELEDFWRDLDLYAGAARFRGQRNTQRGSRERKQDRHMGAFADRCAFLLDSPLLERARRAAAKLHGELESTARKTMNSAFRDEDAGRTTARPKPRRRTGTHAGKRRVRVIKKRATRQKRKGRGRQ